MRVLALDTAQAQAAVTVWDGNPGTDGRVLATRVMAMDRGQAEALLPMVADAMAEAGIGFDALDRIAATRGPGAFTGIRIGLAAARGLGLAANVPVVGVLTTQALAAAVQHDAPAVLVVLDTKRGDFYASLDGAAPQVVAAADLAGYVGGASVAIVGDGAAAARAVLTEAGRVAHMADAAPLVDPVWVARLGATADPTDPLAAPDPLYLRPPAVDMPGVGRVG